MGKVDSSILTFNTVAARGEGFTPDSGLAQVEDIAVLLLKLLLPTTTLL